MHKEPGQVSVERLGIPASGEVTVVESPIGNGTADSVDDLPHAFFSLGGVRFAEKVLAGNDIDGELAPCTWEFAVILFEKDGTVVPFDGGSSGCPFDGIEGVADLFGTECWLYTNAFECGGRLKRVDIGGGRSVQTENGIHIM